VVEGDGGAERDVARPVLLCATPGTSTFRFTTGTMAWSSRLPPAICVVVDHAKRVASTFAATLKTGNGTLLPLPSLSLSAR
jgi:hypothetical protein